MTGDPTLYENKCSCTSCGCKQSVVQDVYDIVGWTVVQDDGSLLKTVSSAGHWFERKNPGKIYTTEKKAALYGTPKPVYMKREL